MSRRQFVVLAMITMVSGLIGGALSNRIFSSSPAFAQGEAIPEKCIQAESFQLVDANGNVRAELCISPEGMPGLALIDENYVTRARFSLTGGGKPAMSFMDEGRRVKARLPFDEEILTASPVIR